MVIAFGVAVLVVVVATAARAQDAIETDRPDQTETASTVGAGRLQFEIGFVYERDERSYDGTFGGDVTMRETSMQVPTALVRIGVAERLELRLESGAQSVETEVFDDLLVVNDRREVSGMSPLSIGFKVELFEEEGLLPQMAFIGDVTLPVTSRPDPEYAAPAFRFTMANTLSDWLSLGYNLGAEWDGVDPKGVGIYTLTLAAALGESFGTYVEAFGEMSTGDLPVHMADGGFTFRPMSNLQFDLSAGIALNEQSPDYYVGAGVSLRLPQ